jgi:hypothetical protein
MCRIKIEGQDKAFFHEMLRKESKVPALVVLGKVVTYRRSSKQPEIIKLLLYVINSNFLLFN